MGDTGLEPSGYTSVKTALSECAGAYTGAINSDSVFQGHLKAQAIDDLQKARTSLSWLVDQSDSPEDSKAATRALELLARAFTELEAGN
jgi:hypothetical protein